MHYEVVTLNVHIAHKIGISTFSTFFQLKIDSGLALPIYPTPSLSDHMNILCCVIESLTYILLLSTANEGRNGKYQSESEYFFFFVN